MRLRRRKKKNRSLKINDASDAYGAAPVEGGNAEVKVAQVVSRRRSLWRRIVENPNLGHQLIIILLALGSENMRVDKRIDVMTTRVEQVKGMAEMVANAMQALRTVSELPRNIKRIIQ